MDLEEKIHISGTEQGGGVPMVKDALTTQSAGAGNGNLLALSFSGENKTCGDKMDIRTYKRKRLESLSPGSKALESGVISLGTGNHLANLVLDSSGLGRQTLHLQEAGVPSSKPAANNSHEGDNASDPLRLATSNCVTTTCQSILSRVTSSMKFVSLSKVLTENFKGVKAENLLNLLNSRVKEGFYENSPLAFYRDIQEVREKLQVIGNEMISLAESLLYLSRTSSFEKDCAGESELYAKPLNSVSHDICGPSTCRNCKKNADDRNCLCCDHCDDIYHIACIEPCLKEIPKKGWYCANCSSNMIASPHDKNMSEGVNVLQNIKDKFCAEIDTLCQETSNKLERNSHCSTYHHSDDLRGEKNSEICKVCQIDVQSGGRIVKCAYPSCPYKFYHVRCLTMKQLALHGPQWYCPSCLCRSCLTNRDDSNVILCDGCDDAYHMYCLEPPLTEIPLGKWFCAKCDAQIRRIGRARSAHEFEEKGKQKHRGGAGYNRDNRNWETTMDNEVIAAGIVHEGENPNYPLKVYDLKTVSTNCQLVLSKISSSVVFASLNKLLAENFEGVKADKFLRLVNSRVEEGFYKDSLKVFCADIQEVWQKLQSIGNEMFQLSKCLSVLSTSYFSKQDGANESEFYIIPWNPASFGIYGPSICKQCDGNAEGGNCLVCDHCEDVYHISCIKPAIMEIPRKCWYCANCISKGLGSPHDNCVVCERLNAAKNLTNNCCAEISTWSREMFIKPNGNSLGSIEPQHSGCEKSSEICKVCRKSVLRGGRVVKCAYQHCPYRIYHQRCLTIQQLTLHGPQWYCPSCLCRYCLTNKDDTQIILCDGCDDAYHMYCVEPRLVEIPSEKWYCVKCDATMGREGGAESLHELGRKSEQRNGKGGTPHECENQKSKKYDVPNQGRGAIDLLLNAVKTLNRVEQMGEN